MIWYWQRRGHTGNTITGICPRFVVVVCGRVIYDINGVAKKINTAIEFGTRHTLVVDETSVDMHLISFVAHHGDNWDGGHFTTFTKWGMPWYEYDDIHVRSVNFDEIRKTQQSTVYMLLFTTDDQLINPPTAPAPRRSTRTSTTVTGNTQ